MVVHVIISNFFFCFLYGFLPIHQLVDSVFSIINYIIDIDRPPHTIFCVIFAFDGAYNRWNLKVSINVSKYKLTNFGRLRHNFLLLFLLSIWIFADTPACKYHLILSEMDNNLHFDQILHFSRTVVPKFKIRLKTYLPKGYLI